MQASSPTFKTVDDVMKVYRDGNYGFIPFPGSPQMFFLRCPWQEGLYGGAAGGMKTETLINDPVPDLLKYPGTNAIFFRRTFPQLRGVIARMEQLFKPLGAEWNGTNKCFVFKNGSRYYAAHMQHEKNKLDYQGLEFEIIIFDELTHFTESQYIYMFSRNRGRSLPEHRWRVRAATNPGGVGHGWVKRRFIDKLEPYRYAHFMRWQDEDIMVPSTAPDAKTRFWVPAKVKDNPIYAGGSYEANLMALPEEERRMLYDGDWSVFTGQFFTAWRKPIHVINPIQLHPSTTTFFGGLDYGDISPTCYVVVAMNADGNAYVVNEYYNTEPGVSIEEHAKAIKDIESNLPGPIVRRVGDWNIFQAQTKDRKESTRYTIHQSFQKYGVNFTHANKDRLAGWRRLKDCLDWHNHDGKKVYKGDEFIKKWPILRFFPQCRNLIRTIPDQIYDEREGSKRRDAAMNDLDTLGEDHAVDALRYVLMHCITPEFIARQKKGWRRKHLRARSTGGVSGYQ